ncbi:MAG: DUF1428 domain-containing protein [Oligoflexia bacterium]|nr:DUF1428 domain-containing protein [Oligoflexia bacterium]
MSYVDGYVLPIPKKNLKAYRAIATKAGKIWKEHGALDYKECVGDDLHIKGMLPFTKIAKAKAGETIIVAYVVFKSRKHRDAVNAKVMKDPRISGMCNPQKMPFDVRRMAYGGFKVIVDPK